MYRVVLTESARRFYEGADGPLQRKLDRCFTLMSQEPRLHPNVKRLKARPKGYWRYRVGDYRVVYRIDEGQCLVILVLITHRKDVYRK